MAEEPEDEEANAVRVAIREDPRLNARQRRALLEVYDSFAGAAPPRRRRRAEPRPDDTNAS
jgi:hypothetical protein